MKRLVGSTILLTFITLFSIDAKAAVDISVMPLKGGDTLRFGRIDTGREASEEVRIRVTSTDGNQYQVFHRLADDFVNEKNAPLGSGAFSTYTLQGSNASGTLYAQSPEQLGFTDQLLYSSAPAGTSDSFTVVYAIDGDRVEAAGSFFGRLQFTVRPVGGASQDDAILNVTVEVTGELQVDVTGSSGPNAVRLSLKDNYDREGFVRIGFRGNLMQEIVVDQDLEPYPQNELFESLDDGVILFSVSGGSPYADIFHTVPVNLTRSMIYRSDASEDEFVVRFVLAAGAAARQKAGAYRGVLRYSVISGGNTQTFEVDLEVTIDPVFAIEIDLPPDGLRFERLLPGGEPLLREVNVEIKTNLGKPYMVMQNLASPMTNEKGDVMPDENFTVRGEILGNEPGRMADTDFHPVPMGEKSIFFSDNKGSPSIFKMVYRLRPFQGMAAGDYSTSVRYTLGEM